MLTSPAGCKRKGPSEATMEPTRLELRWAGHDRSFVAKLDQYRLKGQYCDATIACGGRTYYVHRVVLSACSDFFASVLSSTPGHNPVVILQEVERGALETLLEFVYRGEATIQRDDLPTLLKVADSLRIKGLLGLSVDQACFGGVVPSTGPSSGQTSRALGKKPRHPPRDEMYQRKQAMERGSRQVQEYQTSTEFQARSDVYEGQSQYCSLSQIAKKNEYQPQLGRERHQQMVILPLPLHSEYSSSLYKQHKTINAIPTHYRQHLTSRSPKPNKEQSPQQDLTKSFPNVVQDLSKVSPNVQDLGTRPPLLYHPGSTKPLKPQKSNQVEVMDKTIQAAVKGTGISPRDNTSTSPKSTCERMSQKILPGFCISNTPGTFQNLVASEENSIKTEPLDYDEEPSLCITDDLMDDETFGLPVIDHVNGESQDVCKEPCDNHTSWEPLADFQDDLPTTSLEISNSHLRRELLRPLHSKPKKHSVPHPVIVPRQAPMNEDKEDPLSTLRDYPINSLKDDPLNTPRDGPLDTHRDSPLGTPRDDVEMPLRGPPLRDPPPLMKMEENIPTMVNDLEKEKALQVHMSDTLETSHSGHLLVQAQPTYQTSSPSHFSFHIHNQHLSSVHVNGDSRITELSSSSLELDGPLNLSGPNTNVPEVTEEQNDPFLGKIMTSRKKRLRGPKSWEFLVRLIKDPSTNPYLIHWENKADGVFRLKEPGIIAQRWGRRTGKHTSECLSYDNFARGLRYHYATGALHPVSEKCFVYKFGPKALKALKECDSTVFPYL